MSFLQSELGWDFLLFFALAIPEENTQFWLRQLFNRLEHYFFGVVSGYMTDMKMWTHLSYGTSGERIRLQDEVEIVTQFVVENYRLVLQVSLKEQQ